MVWRLVRFLTRTTLRIGVLVAVVVLSLSLNVAVLAVDSVRDAIAGSLKQLAGSFDGPGPKTSTSTPRPTQADRVNELELENDDLKRRNADLNNDNRYLRRTRDTIRTDLANERALREAITEKGTDITRRMTQRTSRSITANFGSMAAEAVPYVGIAAIVGVTFYEVRDACLTMSDMRELSDMFGTPSSNENRYCGFTLQEFKDQVFNTSSKVDCSNLDMPSEMVEECGKPPAIQRELPEDEPGDALLRPQKP